MASAEALTKTFATLLNRRSCHPAVAQAILKGVLDSQGEHLRRGMIQTLTQNIAAQEGVTSLTRKTEARVERSRPPWGRGCNASDLATVLESAVFRSRPVNGHLPVDELLHSWGYTVARRIFSADLGLEGSNDLQWNSLVLLAAARTRTMNIIGQSAARSPDPVRQVAVVEWRTVCILTILRNLMRSQSVPGALPLNDQNLRGLASVVRDVWHDWTTSLSSVPPRQPLCVTRLICASVFELAGQLKDKSLVDMCREYTITAALWSMNLDDPRTEDGLQEMAAEQLYASLECGTFFERALVDLMVYASHVRTLRAAVDLSIVRYARTDPEHAQELVAWSSNRNIVPTHAVVATVGAALARHGISEYLDRYMNDVRLPPESRERVLLAHLKAYVRQGRHFMAPREVSNVMDCAFLLLSQIDNTMRLIPILQSTLLNLIRHGHARRVVTLVESVSVQQTAMIPALFLTRLLRALIHHRQYSLASHLLKFASSKYPEMTSRWTSLVLFRLYRVQACKPATRVASHTQIRQPSSFVMLADLARNLQTQPRPNPRSITSSLASVGQDTNEPLAWQYSVNLLVRAGRLHDAKQLFLAVHERSSPQVRTSLANTILHGYLLCTRCSNRRRLRLVVDAYQEFTQQYNFSADPVTVNILLKAQLRSRAEVNATQVRELFDLLVQLGYPTGDRLESPPFGTPVRGGIRIASLELPRIDSPLSFKRHVEPMYKTFIKALYRRGDVVAARKLIGMLKILQVPGS